MSLSDTIGYPFHLWNGGYYHIFRHSNHHVLDYIYIYHHDISLLYSDYCWLFIYLFMYLFTYLFTYLFIYFYIYKSWD